jgi:hypothetical protein
MSPQTEDKLVNTIMTLIIALVTIGLLIPGFILLGITLWAMLIDVAGTIFYA